jgi:hypothetical protein
VVKPWSRIAVVSYAMIGIPLVMASFANMGRLFTEFYCIDWIYISSVLRGKGRPFKIYNFLSSEFSGQRFAISPTSCLSKAP